MRGQRAEQPAEGAGQQEGAGARVHALAGDVGEYGFQGASAVGAGGDDEVPGEGLPARRAQRHLAVPALRQPGQGALDPDAFAQIEEHGAAAPPRHPDPGPELGEDQPEEAAGRDHQDDSGGHPGRAVAVRAQRDRLHDQGGGGGRVQAQQAGRAQQQAARDDRQDERGRGTPHRVEEGGAGDGRNGEQQTGQRDPVRSVAAEVVDTGFAQRDACPVRRFPQSGRVRVCSCATGHCGDLIHPAARGAGGPHDNAFEIGSPAVPRPW